MQTFAQLGCPFEFYDASTASCAEFKGPNVCSFCETSSEVTFELGIGAEVIVCCPACGSDTALNAADREPASCLSCNAMVAFPAVRGEDLLCCYACLRQGRAALTKATVLGLVNWHNAIVGVTGGCAGLQRKDFELLPPTGGGWRQARVPKEDLLELVRTPTYFCFQGAYWHFCCRCPMTFIGDWDFEEFSAHAPDGNGLALFKASLDGDGHEEMWARGLRDPESFKMFRCRHCGRLRGNYDT